MMRVALFFDGKNFYRGYKQVASGRRIDFPGMARWLVERVHGTFLWGAYYYTGVGTGEPGEDEGQQSLSRFLDMLETQPGFFVKRFPRKLKALRCPQCQALNRFTQEKEVDTTMVADIMIGAAVGAFDILVLVSGDADHAPAMEGVRALGKQAYVATWSGSGLSSRLRNTAFDHIDLSDGLAVFAREGRSTVVPEAPAMRDSGFLRESPIPVLRDSVVGFEKVEAAVGAAEGGADLDDIDESFLKELRRAQAKFDEGYVGVNYFLTRWQGDVLRDSPEVRRRVLDRLVREGRVEIYTASDGAQAIHERLADDEIAEVWDDQSDSSES